MQHAVLIYSEFNTNRLQYVLDWLCREQLQLAYQLTDDRDAWLQYEGMKLSYTTVPLQEGIIHIKPAALLQEERIIKEQPLHVNRWKHSTILFYNQPGAIIPFDIFAAVFYLVSRYEEYLPYQPDKHGRYPAALSVAAQFAFLQQPVVDEWIAAFREILEKKYGVSLPQKQGSCRFSYDIDMAWKYLHKGKGRTYGGYLRDLVKLKTASIRARRAVLSGKTRDPYDCFDWLDGLHRQYKIQPLYFLLLGKGSAYDKNAVPTLPAMKALTARLAAQYETGIHPSYLSHQAMHILQEEIHLLEMARNKPVTQSRQHYIKFELPDTYRKLVQAGISNDYSMGYASANGFRAGTSNAFTWYDLKEEAVSSLRVHPFAFMDATSKFYAGNNAAETFLEFERLYFAVKKVNGTLFSIWHNYMLGTDKAFAGWPQLYEKVLALTAS